MLHILHTRAFFFTYSSSFYADCRTGQRDSADIVLFFSSFDFPRARSSRGDSPCLLAETAFPEHPEPKGAFMERAAARIASMERVAIKPVVITNYRTSRLTVSRSITVPGREDRETGGKATRTRSEKSIFTFPSVTFPTRDNARLDNFRTIQLSRNADRIGYRKKFGVILSFVVSTSRLSLVYRRGGNAASDASGEAQKHPVGLERVSRASRGTMFALGRGKGLAGRLLTTEMQIEIYISRRFLGSFAPRY